MLTTKILKQFMLVAVIMLAATNVLFSQSYYQSPNDTITANANFDDVSVYNITQMHPGNDTIVFKYYKYSVVLPASWDAYLCDNMFCHPDLKDSSTMIAVPGDNGLMSLHLNPHFESGIGIIRYVMFDSKTPLNVDTLTWIISAGSNGINTYASENPLITYNDQRLLIRNTGDKFDKLNIFNLSGRLLFSTQIGKKEEYVLPFNYKSFIIVQLTGRRNIYTQKINFLID